MLRQIAVLSEFGDVTTVGYGPAPDGVAAHVQVPDELASLPKTMAGVIRLAGRRFRTAQWSAPALAFARTQLGSGRFDLVVANDARALPVAHAAASGAPIWADLHEWAPEEQSHILSWRLLVAPLMTWLCERYLPDAAAVTTVGPGIARLYERRFGVLPEVVRNARPYAELVPSEVNEGRIRLVHSGLAVPERCIETLVDAVLALDERFSLDLYLVFSGDTDPYRRVLVERAAGSDRIVFHDPVAPAALPVALNQYDLGVYVLRPTTENHRLMLPNKFFDFIQARLGLIFGPALELDELIASRGLGLTTDGYTSDDLVAVLSALTSEDVRQFKQRVRDAAHDLSSATDAEVQRAILARLLTQGQRGGPAPRSPEC